MIDKDGARVYAVYGARNVAEIYMIKHLKIEFDWSVKNGREDLAFQLPLNSRIYS